MRDRAHDLAVLQDGAAAHALHDAAGDAEQLRVRDLDDHGAGGPGGLGRQADDLAGKLLHTAAVDGGQDRGGAELHLGLRGRGQALRVERDFITSQTKL